MLCVHLIKTVSVNSMKSDWFYKLRVEYVLIQGDIEFFDSMQYFSYKKDLHEMKLFKVKGSFTKFCLCIFCIAMLDLL